jgi:hypothetical protein
MAFNQFGPCWEFGIVDELNNRSIHCSGNAGATHANPKTITSFKYHTRTQLTNHIHANVA